MFMIKDENMAFAAGLHDYLNQELSHCIESEINANRWRKSQFVDLCFLAVESSIDFFLPCRLSVKKVTASFSLLWNGPRMVF